MRIFLHCSTTLFSRACRVCPVDDPPSRAVFVECGHAVCGDCADAAASDAESRECPLCLTAGNYKPLYEEHDVDDESRLEFISFFPVFLQ